MSWVCSDPPWWLMPTLTVLANISNKRVGGTAAVPRLRLLGRTNRLVQRVKTFAGFTSRLIQGEPVASDPPAGVAKDLSPDLTTAP